MRKNFDVEYGNQIKTIDNDIKEVRKLAGQIESEIVQAQTEVNKLLADQQKLASEKDLLLMRKHLQDELKNNPGKRKKFFDEEISKIKLQSSLQQKEITDTTKSLDLAKNAILELSQRQSETQNQIDGSMAQIERA